MSAPITIDGEAMVRVETLADAFAVDEMRDWVEGWFATFGEFCELGLFVRKVGTRNLLQAAVRIRGDWYRAHIERTVCDACGYRVRAAAVPIADSKSGLSAEQKAAVNKKINALPILPCPHCGHILRLRCVFWLVPGEEPNQTASGKAGVASPAKVERHCPGLPEKV